MKHSSDFCSGSNNGIDPAAAMAESSPAKKEHKDKHGNHNRDVGQKIPNFRCGEFSGPRMQWIDLEWRCGSDDGGNHNNHPDAHGNHPKPVGLLLLKTLIVERLADELASGPWTQPAAKGPSEKEAGEEDADNGDHAQIDHAGFDAH
jgi:hypothetical protein